MAQSSGLLGTRLGADEAACTLAVHHAFLWMLKSVFFLLSCSIPGRKMLAFPHLGADGLRKSIIFQRQGMAAEAGLW